MIKINGQNIKNILLGSAPIKKVLINETQIWSAEEPEEPEEQTEEPSEEPGE